MKFATKVWQKFSVLSRWVRTQCVNCVFFFYFSCKNEKFFLFLQTILDVKSDCYLKRNLLSYTSKDNPRRAEDSKTNQSGEIGELKGKPLGGVESLYIL